MQSVTVNSALTSHDIQAAEGSKQNATHHRRLWLADGKLTEPDWSIQARERWRVDY